MCGSLLQMYCKIKTTAQKNICYYYVFILAKLTKILFLIFYLYLKMKYIEAFFWLLRIPYLPQDCLNRAIIITNSFLFLNTINKSLYSEKFIFQILLLILLLCSTNCSVICTDVFVILMLLIPSV